MSASKGSGGKGHGKGRSLGAAASSSKPAGAILDDGEERFKKWAKGYREKKLKPNAHEKLYPRPVDHWKMD